MSGTAWTAPPTAVLGLGLSGPWYQRSKALVHTYPLHPAGESRGEKTPLRLPSLVATAKGHRSSKARLSLSEPSLLTPKENNIFAEFSSNSRHGVSQKRTLPSPSFGKSWSPFKTCHPSGTSKSHLQQNHRRQVESCSRPTYIHFSQAIQPNSKPKPARHISHNQALNSEMAQGDLRALAMQIPNSSSKSEPLSVIGKPCLLNCSHGPVMAATPGSGRTQLHVFLPTEEEGEREGEEVDCESVDEGFMDELDSKITSLKLQQGAPKTVTYH